MPLEYEFDCPLPNGIHARPASALEEVVRHFTSEVTLINRRTQRSANGKSILAIIGTDVRAGDSCLITVSGSDEREAMVVLSTFLRDKFPHCDASLAPTKAEAAAPLSPCLSHAGATIHRGRSVVPGIGSGRGVRFGAFSIPPSLPREGVANTQMEWHRLNQALHKLNTAYDNRLKQARGIEAELVKVHQSIARDVDFQDSLQAAVIRRQHTAAGAIEAAEAQFSKMLAASGNEMLRERAMDVQDVCLQLLHEMYGDAAKVVGVKLTSDAVIVAESLTPGQFLSLDRKYFKGLVLASASSTSHTVILARSFNIPTLAGVPELATIRFGQHEIVVDADAGALVTDLTDTARRYYVLESRRIIGHRARLKLLSARAATTKDGQRIEIAANISTASEAAGAFDSGAEGIGLFRTEMLFLDRSTPPDETEQFDSYAAVITAAAGRPVVIRTFDVGGDKPLAYLNLPKEENPFLGRRAVRIYPEFETLFRTQIRALVRASAGGKLSVMIPMIATVEEARWVKRIVAEEQQKCEAEKNAFDPAMLVGAMIEVPAAALAVEAFSRELDFFSIGSNDLLQYFMAADRMESELMTLLNPLQPAFLRLLKLIADAARSHNKEISLCGEMGGQVRYLPLLAGMGLNKISAAAPAVAGLKAELARLNQMACQQLLTAAISCATADEVSALLEQFSTQAGVPLVETELVLLDPDATSKEEVIKQGVDRLFIMGRTESSQAVEEAIWRREATYSTGFGHGFAIPHCQTNAVRFNSLVLMKLKNPVAWNSLDGQPVRVVILLGIRAAQAGTAHMQVLARLARKIMDEEFRAELERETDPARLCAVLQKIF
ncbi:MAG TPA: phosphoenolpyruvate--protein phosphotransferase [Verrucomicrobiae bacterium]|nr:phosphoenolpyruvate--protein phosphotransferase [Verrucomicrobiae bacterium]